METLRDRMEADLKIGGYSPSTRKIYLLRKRFGRRPDANRTASGRPRLGLPQQLSIRINSMAYSVILSLFIIEGLDSYSHKSSKSR